MEGEVHQHRPLLDEPKVEALLLELPLLSFAEVLRPNSIIFEINIGHKEIVEVCKISLSILLCKLDLPHCQVLVFGCGFLAEI